MYPRPRKYLWFSLQVGAILLLIAAKARAQAPSGDAADQFLQGFRNARAPMLVAFQTYAGGLFRALALCEMAWVGILLVLERADLQGFTATLLRKLLVLFFFQYLLLNGANASDAIMNSFIDYGLAAAGLPVGQTFSVANLIWQGVTIAVNLMETAGWSGLLLGPLGVAIVGLAGLIIVVSFCVVGINFIMALVESYITVSAGLLFLGFGGSSVTRPYVERFFALAVATGVKLMVIYLIVGVGQVLSATWQAEAANFTTALSPIQTIFDILTGSLIFAAISWGVPRFAASLLSGSPNFTGGDLIGMGFNVVQAGLLATAVGGAAVRGAALLAGSGASRLAAASSMGGGSAGAGGVPGPSGPSGGGGPGSGRYGFGGGGDGPIPSARQASPPGASAAASPVTSGSPPEPGSSGPATGSAQGSFAFAEATPTEGPTSGGAPGPTVSSSWMPPGVDVMPPSASQGWTKKAPNRIADIAGLVRDKALRGIQMTYYLQRIAPNDHANISAPSANLHGE